MNDVQFFRKYADILAEVTQTPQLKGVDKIAALIMQQANGVEEDIVNEGLAAKIAALAAAGIIGIAGMGAAHAGSVPSGPAAAQPYIVHVARDTAVKKAEARIAQIKAKGLQLSQDEAKDMAYDIAYAIAADSKATRTSTFAARDANKLDNHSANMSTDLDARMANDAYKQAGSDPTGFLKSRSSKF